MLSLYPLQLLSLCTNSLISCCLNQFLLVWFRDFYGCDRSFRWSWCPTQLRMHWYTLCVLHGRQCYYLPTLCGDREHQATTNAIIPLLIFTHCYHIHSHMALRNSRACQNCLTHCHCHRRHRCLANFQLRGTSITETWILGRPLDAMDTLCINLPKLVLARVPRWLVLYKIRVLFDPRRACLCVVWRPFKLRCWRRRFPIRKKQGDSRITKQLQSIVYVIVSFTRQIKTLLYKESKKGFRKVESCKYSLWVLKWFFLVQRVGREFWIFDLIS